jgi:diguanylate cyclase (GGDEF)-like protein
MSARMLEANLTKSGYEVTVVSDGGLALEILKSDDRPPMAILDWMMPVMDGPEVCRQVRHAGGPYVYMLLLTGNSDPSAVVTGIDAGADDYIRKPFDSAELQARLRTGKRIVELEEKLRRQATSDALTGLQNRGAVLDRLATEMERSSREGSPLCIAILDLDHFKSINDTYGHSAGDATLCEAAKRMSSVLRPYDVLGRYGGEEFIVVFPKCDEAIALGIAERIRGAVAQPMTIDSHQMSITTSIGVARFIPPTTADAVIRAADHALLRAKQSGRNRVELAS